MSRRPLKVVTVNTADVGGGAERRAWCLFKGFERRGVDSWMLVGQKLSNDRRVVPFHQSAHLDYRFYAFFLYRWLLQCRKAVATHLGREDFHFPFSRHLLKLTGRRPDLVHCQNLHGGYFDLRALASVSRRVPVFLTLHDSWTFTGHCAQPFDCERWRTGCGSCPYLSAPPALTRDGTRANWREKQRIYSRSRLHVAAPSHWLLKRAQQSMLAPAMVDSRVITPGVDLSVFRPGSKAAARHRLDIPQESAVVVFVANQGRHNAFKDYPTMRSAMLRLADEPGTRPITLYCIGDAADDERRGRLVIRHVPYVRSSERLADFYRAADVYLHAARLEAFGLTIAEAMACGVPVVASRVGGIPEVFIHDRHGYCVPPGDAGAIADAVSALLGERGLRQQMVMRACDYAHEVYDQERMIDAYLAWFLQHVGKDAYLPAKRAVSSRDLVSYRTG